MPKLFVDGIEVEVPAGATVLQAAELAGKEIPRFCFHERLSIAGNCRMCLVEVERAPKPVASCAYPVADGMKVFTDTPTVRAARRGVMEFLLINHPLDCPICDQGGECDLQDQAMGYGMDHSRYAENKRAVKDKDLGPLVKTVMTRCIHCTRCIRFATEVAGVPELGATGRGEVMEVGTYVQHALESELSGNLIDLCPVGALTSKPYAFVARPWELRKTDGIDVSDAVGANIRIDTRGPEVLRILPRLNEDVNEEWLGDKGRFWIDGLKRRRLDTPWVRRDGRMMRASWAEAFDAIAQRLHGVPGERIGAIVGDQADAEAIVALKDLMAALGSTNLDCRQDGAALDSSRRDFYLFNTGFAGVEEGDALVLVGSDPRREAPVLNARIRKRWLMGGFRAGRIGGGANDLTYAVTDLADFAAALDVLRDAKYPMVVVGQGALRGPQGADALAASWRLIAEAGGLRPDWHGFNLLHTAAARVGALDLGFVSGLSAQQMARGAVDVLFLLGADELDVQAIPQGTFVIYQGHHGDAGARRADVILPGAAYTEKNGTWVNSEGRVQRGYAATHPPGEAREDWRILRALSARLDKPLPYDDLGAVRERLIAVNPIFARVDQPPPRGCADPAGPTGGTPTDCAFPPAVQEYFRTDPISRASDTMAACIASRAPVPALAAE